MHAWESLDTNGYSSLTPMAFSVDQTLKLHLDNKKRNHMKKASGYDLEIPQSHTADLDRPTAP